MLFFVSRRITLTDQSVFFSTFAMKELSNRISVGISVSRGDAHVSSLSSLFAILSNNYDLVFPDVGSYRKGFNIKQ